MATDRAVRGADAPADPPEPEVKRVAVMAAFGRLLAEGYTRRRAEGGDVETETALRDPEQSSDD